MKLHAKVLALLVALFAVLAVAQFAVEQRMLLPSFSALERQAAHQDMDRVALAIEREVQTLSVITRDWGNWVETWDFMRTRDMKFAQSNLSLAEIASLLPTLFPALAAIAIVPPLAWPRGLDRARLASLPYVTIRG